MAGEPTEARVARIKFREKQEEHTTKLLEEAGAATGSAAVEQMRYDAQLAQIEAKYPVLNPDMDEFDQEQSDEVSELYSAFQAKGYRAGPALVKAVGYVMRDVETVGKDADLERDKRAQKARKKVAGVKDKTPPDISKAGKDSDKGGSDDGLPDISKMSPEQFAKLTPSQLSKIRQDTLSEEQGA